MKVTGTFIQQKQRKEHQLDLRHNANIFSFMLGLVSPATQTYGSLSPAHFVIKWKQEDSHFQQKVR